MRMWMINPNILCKKHLIGEHGEIHKHRHNFVKQHSITGRIFPVVQIEPRSMLIRHDQLVKEMLRRGYNHNSPYKMPDISYLSELVQNVKVDLNIALSDLLNRCNECRKRYNLLKDDT